MWSDFDNLFYELKPEQPSVSGEHVQPEQPSVSEEHVCVKLYPNGKGAIYLNTWLDSPEVQKVQEAIAGRLKEEWQEQEGQQEAQKQEKRRQELLLQSFKDSEAGTKAKQQIENSLTAIERWAESNGLSVNSFLQRLQELFLGSNGEVAFQVYSKRKRELEYVQYGLLYADSPPLEVKKSLVETYLLKEHLCAPGAINDVESLKGALETDWISILANVRKTLVQQFAAEFLGCLRQKIKSRGENPEEANYEFSLRKANETHVAASFADTVAKQWGFRETGDKYSVKLNDTSFSKFAGYIDDRFTVSTFFEALVEEIKAEAVCVKTNSQQKRFCRKLDALGSDEGFNLHYIFEEYVPDTKSNQVMRLIEDDKEITFQLFTTLLRRANNAGYINPKKIKQSSFKGDLFTLLTDNLAFSWVDSKDTFKVPYRTSLLDYIKAWTSDEKKTFFLSLINRQIMHVSQLEISYENLLESNKLNEEIFSLFSVLQAVGCFKGNNKKLLFLAVKRGCVQIFRALGEKADIDFYQKNEEGKTLLEVAVEGNHFDIVEQLFKKANITADSINENSYQGQTLLHFAVRRNHLELVKSLRRNHLELVKSLIKKGADVNAKNQEGKTPLQLAVRHNNTKLVKFLIENGADIHAVDKSNHTALDIAVAHSFYDIVTTLVEKGIENVAVTDLFFWAIGSTDFLLVKVLVDVGVDVNQARKNGDTPLHIAVICGCHGIVNILVSKGADINAKNQEGETPLHLAVRRNHLKLVQFLIEKEANVNAKNQEGETPLHIAAALNHSLNIAAAFNHSLIVSILVPNGADVNAQDKRGQTPLHIAVRHNNTKLVKFLIENGADIHAVDKRNHTALDIVAAVGFYDIVTTLVKKSIEKDIENVAVTDLFFKAINEGNVSLVKVLVDAGVDINAKNQEGETPLHLAVRRNHLKLVQFLIEKEADINAKNQCGETPLHIAAALNHSLNIAAALNHSLIVNILVPNGADVNAQDKRGQTLLHIAVARGHFDIVQRLLKCGADVNKLDNNSKTPLYEAAANGHVEIVLELIKKGAEVNQGDNEGKTPLYVAAKNGHNSVVKCLLDSEKITITQEQFNRSLFEASHNKHFEVVITLLDKNFGQFEQLKAQGAFLLRRVLALKDDKLDPTVKEAVLKGLISQGNFGDDLKNIAQLNCWFHTFLDSVHRSMRSALISAIADRFMDHFVSKEKQAAILEKNLICFEAMLKNYSFVRLHRRFYKEVLKQLKENILGRLKETQLLEMWRRTGQIEQIERVQHVLGYQRGFVPNFFKTNSMKRLDELLYEQQGHLKKSVAPSKLTT